ncbi:MAG: hypothetical protein ABH830_04440 [Patescibacteria group bacterium]
MMKKNIIFFIIALLIIVAGILIFTLNFNPLNSSRRCHEKCIKDGWEDGQCNWPSEMNEAEWNSIMKRQIEKYSATFPYAEITNRGSCVESFFGVKSRHCGNEGQCNCYCFNYKEGYDDWLTNTK